ncbi:cytochrome c oxidase assembly factor 5-like [Paramacrobiotus metropolitanus]|uniref:cytochrome c oxidase assembly factor 5-like n=1 Tax=Paramacrobiotus metropolitanus TaxID=2943436 RepID=UPI002445989D|nr:cytochrome c oxidase assembly factor 5-like [Paramacrobiotus metropolitanus]
MVNYYDEVRLKDHSPCAEVRADLKNCLLQTDCCAVERKTPKQCLIEHHPSVPDECYALRTAFFECKRSLIDMRSRFRGPKAQ